jgi:hypothetical protein
MSAAAASVDEHNPWLGLAAFTEATRVFFFGREQEVAELERRVQRKLLTVLFGKSGLGKTSILQAGLVPQLRGAGYFPVYLRIDYGRDAAEPSEQIKQAIGQAASSGHWTRLGVVDPEESIWEFLHHRDAVLKDSTGLTLIPLLIFDQFEELFTLAQSDEFGRARAVRFIEELADLVENRPPRALEAKFEADEGGAERFDFSRSDYRVVISLREDYLAPLESLKKTMPSLSQNRLRLAPMTGSQGLEAVRRPGRNLVSEEVAAAIVRFVAGGSELANAEVEPALLSLVCRELNEQRISQQRAEISLDLLAGSHESILSSFYERSLADQPASVRRIVEDELLTDSGYRENLAEERVLRLLQIAGASPDALRALVNRRLLRIEERLDVRRVELTHDVLTAVVKASRDQRQAREAREATERLLAEQNARAHAAQRALRRARMIAAGCTALAALAAVAAVLAIMNVQRARRAESDALQTRLLSEQGRNQAQRLLGFLTDDFVQELETFGRYHTVIDLSQREIDYFNALPPKLKDAQTVRDGALAYANHAGASMYLGDTNGGIKSAAAGIALLEVLRRAGDRSEATAIALARVYTNLGKLQGNQVSREEFTDVNRAADLLRAIATKPGASREVRRAYVEVLISTGAAGIADNQNEEVVRSEREAQRLALQLGARSVHSLVLDADYATAGSWLTWGLANLNRNEEARRSGEDTLQVIDQILTQRPQYGEILLAKQMAEDAVSRAASADLNAAAAARFAIQAEQASQELVALEPGNTYYRNELGTAYSRVGDTLWAAARLREAIPNYRKSLDTFGQLSASATFYVVNLNDTMHYTVLHQAQLGDASGAVATLNAAAAFTKNLNLGDSFPAGWVNALRAYLKATLAYERDDFVTARGLADDARLVWLVARPDGGPFQIAMKNYALYHLSDVEAQAEYRLGHFVAAAQLARTAVQACSADVGLATSPREVSQASIWLSMALAQAGQRAQAAQVLDPVVAQYRALEKRNHGDQWLPLELAEALYAQSLSDARQAPALLSEATQLLDHLAPTIAALHDTQQWRASVRKARNPVAQQ